LVITSAFWTTFYLEAVLALALTAVFCLVSVLAFTATFSAVLALAAVLISDFSLALFSALALV